MESCWRRELDATEELVPGILETVADATGTPVESLDEPLYAAIDGEALTQLVRSADERLTVTFRYQSTRVTVHGDRTVAVEPDT